MNIFIARQPIFNADMNVVAYELLYRKNKVNRSYSNGDDASSSVIINGMVLMGIEAITEGKKAFIKLTKNLILDETALLFPVDNIVVEVMDDIGGNRVFLEALRALKRQGRSLALDDYRETNEFESVEELADYVKVDFQSMSYESLERISKRFKGAKAALLAEKIETHEQFETARRLGFKFFQGFFFEEPNILASKDIQVLKYSHVHILQELGAEQPNFLTLSDVIHRDLSLSYKLLKLVNSAAYTAGHKISSIHQAMVRIGVKELYKLMALVIMRDAGQSKPEELVRVSLIRARALEKLAEKVKLDHVASKYFLLGIFSLIDVILDRPMAEVMADLPLDEDIKDALTGSDNLLRKGLEIIAAYEKAEWDRIDAIGGLGDGFKDEMLFMVYFEAIKWTQELDI